MNTELLEALNKISVYWNRSEDREEPLTWLQNHIKNAVDFSDEMVEIIEFANAIDEDGDEDPFQNLVPALMYNCRENREHLLFIYNYLATRAVTIHDYYSYFLFNQINYEEFVKEVPEVAVEIIPLLTPLLKSDFNLNKEFAIKTGRYCLWENPQADRNNFVLALQDSLKDPDWKIRYYAFKCLKKNKLLPAGFRRPFKDVLLPIIFHKEIKE